MVLNKQKGNMYGFVTDTWNTVKGKCPHDCSYCYMKVFPQNNIRFDEKELETDLGKGKTIFIGSSTDMWADSILISWIARILNHIEKYPNNTYLFQSKNPRRFIGWNDRLKKSNVIIGTTIETNRENKFTGGQPIRDRAKSMAMLEGCRTFVTIEPIMDFDLDELVFLIKGIQPEFVNIGADSKNHKLPEPSCLKTEALINELSKFTKVNQKDNLKRLLT